jgi:glycosyltransferase involved in cell wall biosynthesis
MKILVVQESDWIKRGPHQQHHLMERLSLKGHEIRVIDYPILWKEEDGGLFDRGEFIEDVSKYYPGSRVDVIRPPVIRLPFFDMLSIPLFHPHYIIKQVKTFKPDVIIGFGIINALIANIIARYYNIPFIYYLLDSLHTLIIEKPYRIIAKLIERITLLLSNNILTINQALKDYTITMGANPKNVTVISAGIDLEKYRSLVYRNMVRSKYAIKSDDIVLFFMGWLYPFSGLMEVAHSIISEMVNTSIKLMIVGDGDLYGRLSKLASSDKRIILTGKVEYSEIPGLLSAADICILPAYNNEIMRNIVPIKLYEYMASSKPIISTRLKGIHQEFGDEIGIVYVNTSIEVLDKVKELVLLNRLDDLGMLSLNYVKKYDWHDITNIFHDYIQSLIGSK